MDEAVVCTTDVERILQPGKQLDPGQAVHAQIGVEPGIQGEQVRNVAAALAQQVGNDAEQAFAMILGLLRRC